MRVVWGQELVHEIRFSYSRGHNFASIFILLHPNIHLDGISVKGAGIYKAPFLPLTEVFIFC